MSEYIVDRENVWPYGSQREEVVRCRDCAEADGESEPGNLHCMVNEWRKVEPDDYCSWGEVEPDDYCSWGERRER